MIFIESVLLETYDLSFNQDRKIWTVLECLVVNLNWLKRNAGIVKIAPFYCYVI